MQLPARLPRGFRAAAAGHRRNAPADRRCAGRAGRLDHQAECRSPCGGDRSLVARLCDAGLDFIKDDEICRRSGPRAARRAHSGRHGRRARASGPHRQACDGGLQHHRRDRRHAPPCRSGGARRRQLRDGQPELVRLLRHRDPAPQRPIWRCTGTATATARSRVIPLLGIGFQAYQTLWRLAGVDHMHVHGLQGKFAQDDEEVIVVGARLPHAAGRRQRRPRDAGLLLRAMGRHRAGRPSTRSAIPTCCSCRAAASWRIPAGRRPASPASARPGRRSRTACRSPRPRARIAELARGARDFGGPSQ